MTARWTTNNLSADNQVGDIAIGDGREHGCPGRRRCATRDVTTNRVMAVTDAHRAHTL
jgi:hypothetical protein